MQAAIAIPPLENGLHLSRAEFEYRYHAMPGIQAELIEGIVQMASPVRARHHGFPHGLMVTWLGAYYATAREAVMFYDNATLRLDADNEPQPDALLCFAEQAGGQCRITPDDYLEGAPELVVEVAASTASYDLHQKRTVYHRNGVREYLLWRVNDKTIDWYTLERGLNAKLPPDTDGFVHSRLFPGLVLDVRAMLAGDLTRVLAVLGQAADNGMSVVK